MYLFFSQNLKHNYLKPSPHTSLFTFMVQKFPHHMKFFACFFQRFYYILCPADEDHAECFIILPVYYVHNAVSSEIVLLRKNE